jgi:predicted GNAT family N-acyltransferase
MEVKRISASDTYPIRHKILRAGKPIESCYYHGDKDELTFHLGAFVDKKLVSVASFYFENHQQFQEKHPNQFRLRGMATLAEYQGMGLSSQLLKTALPLIKQNLCTLLWCNARATAEGFYKKVGFEAHGEIFDIPEIGPHRLMTINLN